MLTKQEFDVLCEPYGNVEEEFVDYRIKAKKEHLWIPKEEMIKGCLYLCNGRNFTKGFWNGKEFEYKRFKFGGYFMATELHWDEGPPHGTAKPIKLLN